jgi:hypothetical protein
MSARMAFFRGALGERETQRHGGLDPHDGRLFLAQKAQQRALGVGQLEKAERLDATAQGVDFFLHFFLLQKFFHLGAHHLALGFARRLRFGTHRQRDFGNGVPALAEHSLQRHLHAGLAAHRGQQLRKRGAHFRSRIRQAHFDFRQRVGAQIGDRFRGEGLQAAAAERFEQCGQGFERAHFSERFDGGFGVRVDGVAGHVGEAGDDGGVFDLELSEHHRGRDAFARRLVFKHLHDAFEGVHLFRAP